MRRLLIPAALLASGLACSGVLGDAPALDEPMGDDDDDDDDDVEGDDDDDDDDDRTTVGGAVPDCTVDMIGVLLGAPGMGGPKKDVAKSPVDVRRGPSSTAKAVAQITPKGMINARTDKAFCKGMHGDDSCVGAAVALQQFGLPVYEENSGWVLVGMGRGGNILEGGTCQRRLWVEVDKPLKLEPVVDLLDTSMAYVRAGMEIELHDKADGELLDDAPEGDGEDVPARVTDSEEVDGRTWVEVELYDKLPCDGEQEKVAEGWMPLHDDAGRLQLWFYTDC